MRNPEEIAASLRAAETVAICSHISPDGDTIGSTLAMRLALQEMGKRVRLFCEDKVPDNLYFLPGVEEFSPAEGCEETFDLLLAMDSADSARLGSSWTLLRPRCHHTAQIDHHGTNPMYAEVNSVDGGAAATCVMLPQQMEALGVSMTREIALCLYAGISTDTGNFSFECTNAEVFRVMASLMDIGLPLAKLNRVLFRLRSRPHLKLLGRAIEGLTFRGDGDIALMKLTLKDFAECDAKSEHADTIVNYGLETVGTRMAVLVQETEDGSVKCSLRAEAPLTVDGIANRLGGGGHAQAAGITMAGPMDEAAERVVQAMMEYLEEAKKRQ